MSAFLDYYKKHLFKQSDGQRLAAICELDKQMQAIVDPTRWRLILDDKQKLEEEKKEILSRSGNFKMA